MTADSTPAPVKCGARNGTYICAHIMPRTVSGDVATNHGGMHHMTFSSGGGPRVAYWSEPYGAVSYGPVRGAGK